jgi:hypothetical protein
LHCICHCDSLEVTYDEAKEKWRMRKLEIYDADSLQPRVRQNSSSADVARTDYSSPICRGLTALGSDQNGVKETCVLASKIRVSCTQSRLFNSYSLTECKRQPSPSQNNLPITSILTLLLCPSSTCVPFSGAILHKGYHHSLKHPSGVRSEN